MEDGSFESRVNDKVRAAERDAGRLDRRQETQDQIKRMITEQTRSLAQQARDEARRAAALLVSKGIEPDKKILVRSTPKAIQQEVGRTIFGRKLSRTKKIFEKEYEKMLVIPMGVTSRTQSIDGIGDSESRSIQHYRPIGIAINKEGNLFKVAGTETTAGPRVTEIPCNLVGAVTDEDIVTLRGVMPGDTIVMPEVTIKPFIERLEATVANLIVNSQST